jgi:hypothetical protein
MPSLSLSLHDVIATPDAAQAALTFVAAPGCNRTGVSGSAQYAPSQSLTITAVAVSLTIATVL